MKQKKYIPLEEEEDKLLVQYCELKGYLFSHIHNEMWTRSWKQKLKAKAMGVRSGMPDFIVIAKNKIVFIEMKRAKKSLSHISQEQKIWIEAINQCGIPAKVCYGFDEARGFIESVIK